MTGIIVETVDCNKCQYKKQCYTSSKRSICMELLKGFKRCASDHNYETKFIVETDSSRSEVEARVVLFKLKYSFFLPKVEII